MRVLAPFGGFEIHEIFGLEVLDFAGDLDYQFGGVPRLNLTDAGTPSGETIPGRIRADPKWTRKGN